MASVNSSVEITLTREEKDFCSNCNEICSRHCVVWRKAEMRHDEAERMTKLGIKETVAKWKDRLEQEPCEDAVSRKKVLNTLNRMDSVLDEDRTVETYKELLAACYKDLPSVTPTRKKGKWINKSQKSSRGIIFVASECTCCGMKTPFDCDNFIYRYCPNCGAEMEGEE